MNPVLPPIEPQWTQPIREVVYERHGSRHAIPARTKDGVGIERQTEVVILDIQKGVAIVQPWTELMDELSVED